MSKRKPEMPVASRTVSFYHKPYNQAMEFVEKEHTRIFEVIRRAWASPSPEETARRIGEGAQASGMSFDEVLFWLWEHLCMHGSGSIWMDGNDRLNLKA